MFQYFLVFLDFEPIISQFSACFTANSRRFLQRCFQKHMTTGKNRDAMLWQMLKDSRTKSLNSQLSNTSPKYYPRTTLQEPHALQKFLCKGFLLIFFPKFLCKNFLRRFFLQKFFCKCFQAFSPEVSLQIIFFDFFLQKFFCKYVFRFFSKSFSANAFIDFFLQQFLCKYFLRRFVSRSFSANVFFGDFFLQKFLCKYFLRRLFFQKFLCTCFFEGFFSRSFSANYFLRRLFLQKFLCKCFLR